MKRLLLIVMMVCAAPAWAALNVFATVPEWGALAQELGADKLKVFTATSGLQDPHRVDAKPSLIARARTADLVLATGADLEVGWLPLVLRDSLNARVQQGQLGYFEAAQQVRMREVPGRLDRADGDVHAGGNPHIQTDPRNILAVASALTLRLKMLDPANASAYDAAGRRFAERWQTAMGRWEAQAAPLRGVPVLVQHRAFPYLVDWLGLREIGSLEQKPGVEPSSAWLTEVLARQRAQPARLVLRAAYQYDAPSRWLAERSRIAVVTLPFTVGGTPEAKDLFSLFDETIKRLLQGLATQ